MNTPHFILRLLAAQEPHVAPLSPVPGDPGFLALLEQHGGWGLSVILFGAIIWLARNVMKLNQTRMDDVKDADERAETEREKILSECRDERRAISGRNGEIHDQNRERLQVLADSSVAAMTGTRSSLDTLEREQRDTRAKVEELHALMLEQNRRGRGD